MQLATKSRFRANKITNRLSLLRLSKDNLCQPKNQKSFIPVRFLKETHTKHAIHVRFFMNAFFYDISRPKSVQLNYEVRFHEKLMRINAYIML